jgi:hypothetical protein
LAADDLGNLHLIYGEVDADVLHYAWRSDGRWFVVPPALPGRNPSLAVTDNGRVGVAFFRPGGVWFAEPYGGGWAQSLVTPLDEDDGDDHSLAFDSQGTPHVAFRRYEDGFDPHGNFYVLDQLFVANEATSSSWPIELVYGDMILTGGRGCSFLFDNAGLGHIAHFSRYTDAVRYSSGGTGNWTTVNAAYPRFVGDQHIGLGVDGAGVAHICYGDSDNQPDVIKLRYATNGSGEWLSQTIAATGENNYCEIAVDADGRAFVSFHEGTDPEGWLWFADNAEGQWRMVNLGYAGENSSIALDPDGYVHIAFERDGSVWHAVSPEPCGAPE